MGSIRVELGRLEQRRFHRVLHDVDAEPRVFCEPEPAQRLDDIDVPRSVLLSDVLERDRFGEPTRGT